MLSITLGIDIAKDKLDVALYQAQADRYRFADRERRRVGEYVPQFRGVYLYLDRTGYN